MISFMHKYLLKNNTAAAITSLKSTHLCFLNSTHRYLSENVSSKLTCIKALFENYGFTDTQVSTLFKKYPFMITLKVDIAKPKLDFLHSFGFTSSDLCKVLADNGYVMRRSLENCLIPSCEILKGLLKDCKSVIVLVKKHPRVIKQDLRNSVVPNIELLRHYGVQNSRILAMLKQQPGTLLIGANRFKILVKEISEMGFDPGKIHFAGAITVWSGLSKETRERKLDLLRMWGWSDDEILLAFKKQPKIMISSEEKIEQVMDFLVNKMGWNASQISYRPLVMMHSLENWTMPRCLVVRFLLSKGVVEKNLTLSSFIRMSEDNFRKRFVDKFCVDFPEVITLYGGAEDNAQKFSRKITN
ncbi:transcription termination factor MTERF15, mitochondrial-like [Apium graveolens]|uniref:transcription termination factor MTERF15, mitochondrial-like n=2 Tax=Apium graveolens TaxID=4045 RepID=UPI003D7A4E32